MTRHEKWSATVRSGQFVFSKSDLEGQMQFLLMNFFTGISQAAIVDTNLYYKLGLDIKSETHKILLSNVLEYMVADSLIYPAETGYKLTLHGYKIRQNEGYLKYLDKIDADRQRERDNIEASIRTNDSVLKNRFRQNLILGITCFSGLITAIATVGQWHTTAQKDYKNTQTVGTRKPNHRCCRHRDSQSSMTTTDTTRVKPTKKN